MMRADNYKPGKPDAKVADRKERFAALNDFVRARNGWLTSVPGAPDATLECLPGSTIPAELAKQGYELEPAGEGQRILANSIVEKFVRGRGGALVPLTAGSTRPVAETRTHAGIVRVLRYELML
jgi:hypothetical protein